MNKQQLQENRAIAVLRVSDLETGKKAAQAAILGGMRLIEITWNSDQPMQLVSHLRATYPHCFIGAGTIITPEHLQNAIASGAQFLFSPHCNPHLVSLANEANIPIIPGALTPTEMINAWEIGATCVKVFPIQAVGGVNYLKQIKAPLGNIPLIPTGGVNLDNAKAFIEAGAIAVGLSSSLFPSTALQTQNWEIITQAARHLVNLDW